MVSRNRKTRNLSRRGLRVVKLLWGHSGAQSSQFNFFFLLLAAPFVSLSACPSGHRPVSSEMKGNRVGSLLLGGQWPGARRWPTRRPRLAAGELAHHVLNRHAGG